MCLDGLPSKFSARFLSREAHTAVVGTYFETETYIDQDSLTPKDG